MKSFCTLTFFLLLFSATNAQSSKRLNTFNVSRSSLAIQGYDPVSYFTQGKAVEGDKNNSIVHDGVTYYFSTAKNKEVFKASPARYEPQYGGWCAYAMGATGEKVEVDPETFKIVNGKLYLFYNKFFNNTLKSWNKNEKELFQNPEEK